MCHLCLLLLCAESHRHCACLQVSPSEHCHPQRSTGTKGHQQLHQLTASGHAIKAAWSPTPRLTDSASSGEAFLQWARVQAASAGQPLQDFVNFNASVRCSDSSTNSSWRSSTGGRSEDGWGSSSAAGSTPLSSAATAAHLPHDVYVHGCPKPACHQDREETANAVQRMRATANGELGRSLWRYFCALCMGPCCMGFCAAGPCTHSTRSVVVSLQLQRHARAHAVRSQSHPPSQVVTPRHRHSNLQATLTKPCHTNHYVHAQRA